MTFDKNFQKLNRQESRNKNRQNDTNQILSYKIRTIL